MSDCLRFGYLDCQPVWIAKTKDGGTLVVDKQTGFARPSRTARGRSGLS